MKGRVLVSRVDEHIRVEDQHSLLFHHLVERFTVGNIDPESAAPPRRQWQQGSRLTISRRSADKDVLES